MNLFKQTFSTDAHFEFSNDDLWWICNIRQMTTKEATSRTITVKTMPAPASQTSEEEEAPHDEMMANGTASSESTGTTSSNDGKNDNSVASGPSNDNIVEYDDDDDDTPIIYSVPKTQEEFMEFVKKSIDGDCPYDKTLESVADPNIQESIYTSKDVRVDPASKLKIPIPVLVANSVVEWSINISKNNIGFAISHTHEDSDSGDGEEDHDDNHENDIQWLVDPHWIYAPTQPEGSSHAERKHEDGSKVAPEKGSFRIKSPKSLMYPTSILLEFDNTYSWITEKLVSYTIKVIPPSDPKKVERSLRAKEVLPQILKLKKDAEIELAKSAAKVTNSAAQVKEQLSLVEEKEKETQTKRTFLEQNQLHLQQINDDRQEASEVLELKRQELAKHDELVAALAAKLKEMLAVKEQMEIEISTLITDYGNYNKEYQQKLTVIKEIQNEIHTFENAVKEQDDSKTEADQLHQAIIEKAKSSQTNIDFIQYQIDELQLRILK